MPCMYIYQQTLAHPLILYKSQLRPLAWYDGKLSCDVHDVTDHQKPAPQIKQAWHLLVQPWLRVNKDCCAFVE